MKYTSHQAPLRRHRWRAKTQPERRILLRSVVAVVVIFFGLFSTAVPIHADDDNPTVSITPVAPGRSSYLNSRQISLRINVNLVLIPVLVTDPYERPVRGLQKSDFRLFEDGTEQEISQFFTEESPVSIGIVFDTSASMRKKMDQSLQAVREFLSASLPGDEFFLLKFSDRPEPVADFTSNVDDIENTLLSLRPGGWTSLFDAIYLGVNRMKHATHGRKVLLVLSDGGDNNSRYTESEVLEFVKEADVRIFSISILDKSPSLEAIAQESGGRAFQVHKIENLPDLASQVSAELHSEYVLGFVPVERSLDGKYRHVKVEVAPQEIGSPRLHVSWKHGYYSPAL